jgi:hypothetical protein
VNEKNFNYFGIDIGKRKCRTTPKDDRRNDIR